MGDLNQLNVDIKNLYSSNDQPSHLTELNSNLEHVTTNLIGLEQTQQNALSRQNDIKQLVDAEADRLNNKKMTVDEAIETQNRIIYFNDNSRKRYTAYLNITVFIAIILAIIYFLIVFKSNLSFFPDWLFIILMIIIVGGGIIIVCLIYFNIQRHDLYNFDELKFNAPVTQPPDTSNADSKFGLNIKGCINELCCKEPTDWNPATGKCDNSGNIIDNLQPTSTNVPISSISPPLETVPNNPLNPNPSVNPPEFFTTMTTEGFNNYEFIDYAPYK